MFKTDFHLKHRIASAAILATIVCPAQSAFSQTIADVAQAQREKLTAEANPVQINAPVVVAPKAKPVASPQWKLHSIFTVGQKTSAEVVSGHQLLHVRPGSSIGPYKVVAVTFSSMKLESSTGCGRKCPSVKTVRLGETF